MTEVIPGSQSHSPVEARRRPTLQIAVSSHVVRSCSVMPAWKDGDGASRMQELVDSLLGYARAAVAEKAAISPLSLQSALDETIDTLRPKTQETSATIQSSGLPVLRKEAVHARQLLQNLISNGLKYRSEALPKSIISAKHAPEEWITSVTDNGISVRQEYKGVHFWHF